MPEPKPEAAPSNVFSAGRAEQVLKRILGPEIPHPTGTAENDRVRDRILAEYATLRIPATTYRALGCNLNVRFPLLACATVTDVIARVHPGSGPAIVMLSHLDSVPAGPGAADDESGTAAVIESARAITTTHETSLHPILAVNTDGEEADLLGAAAFLDNADFRQQVGAVINVEARGNQGPSLLFQMSPGDSRLLELYARNAPTYATSSLTEVIYKMLPNDTDLTLFIRRGVLSWNFAFNGNLAHYHTSLDRRENMDKASLQMQGDSQLAVVRGLERTKYEDLRGTDEVYISILGRWLPRLPASWALPLSLLATALLGLALAFAKRTSEGNERWWAAGLIFPAALVGAAAVGMLLHEIAVLVSGQPDPSYAYPSALRAALALGVLAVTILVARFSGVRAATFAIWFWFAALSLAASALLTGFSPYFLFPLLWAAPLLFLGSVLKVDLESMTGRLIVGIASLPTLVIWLSFVSLGESIRGLYLNEIFTVPAAVGLLTLVPFLSARNVSRFAWTATAGFVLLGAVAASVVAGLEPAFSAITPQRLSIAYVEDAAKHHAYFSVDGSAPLPSSMRAMAKFSLRPERLLAFSPETYVAPAGQPHLAFPQTDVRIENGQGARHVDLVLRANGGANQVFLAIPTNAGLRAIDIEGKHFAVPPEWAKAAAPYDLVGCFSPDCASKSIELTLGSRAGTKILLAALHYGLAPEAQKLAQVRPATAVPSQNGDTTILINTIDVPSL